MKRFLLILLLALTAFITQAQSFQEEGYTYYYDYDHRVVVRSTVGCNYDYQDLWNGDYVRIINDNVFIYRGGSRFTWGNRVWLESNGQYTVERSGKMYLLDDDGETLVWGDVIYVKWNGTILSRRGGTYYLFDANGYRMGNIYSSEEISLYWNGYYAGMNGDYWYLFDEDGYRVGGSYSEEEPTLTDSGLFRVWRSGRSYLINTSGQVVR